MYLRITQFLKFSNIRILRTDFELHCHILYSKGYYLYLLIKKLANASIEK